MSRLIYSANGNILNKSYIIERMADPLEQLAKDAPVATAVAQAIQSAKSAPASASVAPVIQTNQPDYLNLVGNMKIKGAMIATNFYKEDGKTPLSEVDVIKLGLPPNVYYVNKKMGINQPNPSYDLDVTGTMGVSGNAIFTKNILTEDSLAVGKSATFGGKVSAQDDLIVGKTATFGGKVLAQDDLIVGKTATFGGKVLANDDLIIGKTAAFGGNALFKGSVLAEDSLIVGKTAAFGGNALFKGKVLAEDELTVGKTATFGGRVVAQDELSVGKAATFGDNLYLNKKYVLGDDKFYQTPDGQMKITPQGIMFGGLNNDREINSAQISAGTHEKNSLNIVGMSSDKDTKTRRVDMWAEGGLTLRGSNKEHYRTPSGHMKMSADGIMFGGPNDNTRQVDSAQISAGRHVENSLNIVGMSTGADANTRRVDMWAEGGLTLRGSNKEHYRTPTGQMKLAADGIMFGGTNDNTRQVDSAQISAGRHIANSLNIVGMSANADAGSRRIDMWAEGGLNVYGNINATGAKLLTPAGHTIECAGRQHITGSELLYILNKDGLIVGKEWGGSGNVSIQGNLTVAGTISNGSGAEGYLTCKIAFINHLANPYLTYFNTIPNNTPITSPALSYQIQVPIGDMTDDMDMLALSKFPKNKDNVKAQVCFNISLKKPNTNFDLNDVVSFEVEADDGVAFEYQTDNYLTSTWEPQIANASNNLNTTGWIYQPPKKYTFKIPNYSHDSINSIVKCRITYFQGGGGMALIIRGLKTAITKLGKLV